MPAPQDSATSARRLTGSILDHPGLAIERMPGLPFILEAFRAGVAGALQPLFGEGAGARLEETTSTAVFDAIAEGKGRTAGLLRCEELDARLLVIIDADADRFVIESIFGAGDGESSPAFPPPARPRSNIETRLIGEFLRGLASALEAGFRQSAPAAFAFEGLHILSDVAMLGRRDMPAIAARLQIETKAGACGCTILLPHNLLQALRVELSVEPTGIAGAADPRWARRMEEGLSRARVPVAAVMEEFELTLGEIARLTVGSVLRLAGDGIVEVRLECAGRDMFRARLGQGEGRYCLEIEERIEGEAASRPAAAA
jgi:flagellar motor switch protein FliM